MSHKYRVFLYGFFDTSLRGFEPPAFRLGGERSILLSYRDGCLKQQTYFTLNV